ncbi:MAG: RNA methyltransferase [Thermodesulfobacteriota bacterium]
MVSSKGRLDIALVHYPVYNKNRQEIASAVTNLDLHDLARAARTYGVGTVYIVTPIVDQQELVAEIMGHWQDGYGATYNQDRKEALTVVKVCSDLAQARELAGPLTVLATGAKEREGSLAWPDVRERLREGESFLILFGTAWGLTREVFAECEGALAPISGGDTGYNHLSVRSAVAISLDRLLGQHN